MPRLILSRLATGVPTLLAVSLCVFAIVRLIPGDPARLLAGDFATEQIVDELRQRWRLNDPLPTQYVAYVGGVLRGDLGRSIATSTPVLPELVERFLRTLQLAVAGIAVAAVIGIGAGIVSAVRRAALIDYLATALALAGISTPIFWSGLILILLFSVTLEWLPAGGTGTLRHLVLPAVSLGLFGAGVLARQTRSGLLEVLGQDFVRTARAKGLPERAVVVKHALKNALIPVVTVLGDQFGRLLGGAILTETVFSWPGMGRYLIESISQRDYPAVQGAILVFATAVVVINLLVDLSYGALDPRVRAGVTPTWRRLARHGGARFGAVVVLAFAVVAVLAPWVAPYDPEAIALGTNLLGPSWSHPFGTDSLGRDVLSRTIWGARISLTIGLVSVGLAMVGGVPLGALAAWTGGWTDRLLMRAVDVLVSFPTLLLAIVVITIFGPGLGHAMLAIGVAQVPLYARLTRAAVLRVRVQNFVEAARASGAGEWRIVRRHVLPNCLPPLLVQSTLLFATAILSAAYLGFLGLGAQPPTPEWGTMLAKARDFLRTAPHVSIFPGLTILMTVLGLNLLGDGLRDVLDPQTAG